MEEDDKPRDDANKLQDVTDDIPEVTRQAS